MTLKNTEEKKVLVKYIKCPLIIAKALMPVYFPTLQWKQLSLCLENIFVNTWVTDNPYF